jgi:hypothetical protein
MAAEAEERLLLTLDLSRLGRVTLDLRIDATRFHAVILSPAPLPAELRHGLAEALAAAAELAGRGAGLAFRIAPPDKTATTGARTFWMG